MAHRPNIVLLVGEDTGLHLGCYGHPDAMTPNLDRLASEGARYTRGYTVGPVCAPSRSCLVTGCYPWSIGTHHMRSTLRNPPRLFTHELRDAGYEVLWPGKTDFNFTPPADFASSQRDWLNEGLPHQQPFFAYHNFGVTHESNMWDRGPDGPGYLKWSTSLPEHLRVNPSTVHLPGYVPDVPEVRQQVARYFEALAMQDLQVGRALQQIEASGQAQNTVVIYLTDHGRGLVREKRWCYDAGLHLPLIVRWPGKIEPGGMVEQVISWVDIAPTILAMAGADVPGHYQGQDFLRSSRRYAISGRDRMDEQFDRVRTITDGRYRYIRNDFPHLAWSQRSLYQENQQAMQALRRLEVGGGLSYPADVFMQRNKPAEELYDAETDPDMVHNLAGQPQYAAKRDELARALRDELQRYGDLGMRDERELIAEGLVVDRLDSEYALRIAPLPPEYVHQSGFSCLTQADAERCRPRD